MNDNLILLKKVAMPKGLIVRSVTFTQEDLDCIKQIELNTVDEWLCGCIVDKLKQIAYDNDIKPDESINVALSKEEVKELIFVENKMSDLNNSGILNHLVTLFYSENPDLRSKQYHPTNGSITVVAANKDEAFEKMAYALNQHPDIYCDWIDGIEIEKDN